ncbi:MAG: hypothetical protein R2813_04790 [Flavobacteriales bacterium]
MKTNRHFIIALITSTLTMSLQTVAQDQSVGINGPIEKSAYTYAIGVRAGGESGVTGKYRFGSNAIEGIISIQNNGIGLTGIYEWYAPAFSVPGMNWYYGLGGHADARSQNIYIIEAPRNSTDRLGLGVDGIVGIEYKIAPIPIAVSLDLKPNITAWTNGGIGWGIDPGIGVKIAW